MPVGLRLLCGCVSMGICGALAVTPQLLHPPVQIRDRIELKKTRQFFFDLPTGAFFRATVQSSSTTPEMRLFDSSGRQVVASSTRALTIVPSAGRYRLDLSCAPNAMAGGSYQLDVFVNATPDASEQNLNRAAELRQRGLLEKAHSRQAAQKTFEDALAMYQSLADGPGQRETWRSLATLTRDSGDYNAAGTYFEREIASARTDADRVSETHAFYLWGAMYVDRDRQRALHLFEQSLAAARQIDNLAWRAIVLNATAASICRPKSIAPCYSSGKRKTTRRAQAAGSCARTFCWPKATRLRTGKIFKMPWIVTSRRYPCIAMQAIDSVLPMPLTTRAVRSWKSAIGKAR